MDIVFGQRSLSKHYVLFEEKYFFIFLLIILINIMHEANNLDCTFRANLFVYPVQTVVYAAYKHATSIFAILQRRFILQPQALFQN